MKIANLIISVSVFVVFGLSAQAQDLNSRLNQAQNELMNGKYEVALKTCEDFIASNKGDSVQKATMYGYAGIASEQLKNVSNAIKYFKKAVQLKTPRLDVYDRLISLSKKSGSDEDYEFALIQKRTEFPDFQQSIVKTLAHLYLKNKQYDKLLEATKELTVWFPDNSSFFNYQGLAYQNLGQIDQATTSFKKVLELDPDDAYANMAYGIILYHRANKIFDESKKEYETIKNPDWKDFNKYDKSLAKPKAIYQEALPHLLKAYQEQTYASSLKGILNRIYTRLGEKDKAAQYK